MDARKFTWEDGDIEIRKLDIDDEGLAAELEELSELDNGEQNMGEEEESGDALPNLEHSGGKAYSPKRPVAQSLREGVEPAIAANAPRYSGTHKKPTGNGAGGANDPTRIRTAPDD